MSLLERGTPAAEQQPVAAGTGSGRSGRSGRKAPPRRRRPYVPVPDRSDPGNAALYALLAVLGLYILVPPELRYEGFGGSLGRPATIGGVLLAAWWALSRVVPGQAMRGRQPVRTAAVAYGIAFLLGVGASADRLLQPVEMRGLDRQIFSQMALLGLLLVTVDGLRNWRQVERALRAVVLFGGALSGIGLLQWAFKAEVATWYRATGLSLGIDREFRVRGEGDFQRVQGVLAHPIEFGVVMAMIFPLTVYFALKEQGRYKWFWRALVPLNAFMILLPVSRSSVLTLALAMMVATTAWSWRRRMAMLGAAVLGIALVRIAIPGLVGTIISLFKNFGQDDSIRGRLEDYDAIGSFAEGHEWFGRGPGTWVTNQLDYFTLDNQWLLTLMELGVVGVVTCAAIYIAGIVLGLRAAQLAPNEDAKAMIKAVTGAVVGALGASFTFDSIAFTGHMAVTFVMVGLAGAMWRISRRGEIPSS